LERHLALLRYSLHLRHRSAAWNKADALEEKAYEGLLRWATRTGQTPQRVIAALRQVEQITQDIPSPDQLIQWDYWLMQRAIRAEPNEPVRTPRTPSGAFWLRLGWQWLPWERARALRMLNYGTAQSLDTLHRVEAAVAEGTQPELLSYRQRFEAWLDPLVAEIYSPDAAWWIVRSYLRAETRRRANRVILALEAWKLEHGGKLPPSLDALVGKYLDRILPDPYSGEPLLYFREGLSIPRPLPHSVDQWTGTVPPDSIFSGKPFLWSTGSDVRKFVPAMGIDKKYYIVVGSVGGVDDWRQPVSEVDVWRAGWAFPIP